MITKRQSEVLNYIEWYEDELGYRPSLEDIKSHLKLSSVSTAHYHVSNLKIAGYLTQDGHSNRLNDGKRNLNEQQLWKYLEKNARSVPILGTANAGDATFFASENIEGYLKIPENLRINRECIFALRVSGDSMNQARIDGKNIEDGDYVLIDSKFRIPTDGDYVLSIIDDFANIKKFEREKNLGLIRLVSESSNPIHKPIYISSEDNFMVNGKIIAVIKK